MIVQSTMDAKGLADWTEQMTNPHKKAPKKETRKQSYYAFRPEKPPKAKPLCPHRWRIEEPNGPTSEGKCSVCGRSRTFLNYDQDDFESRQRSWKELN